MTNNNPDFFDRIMLLPGLRLFNGIYKKYKAVLLYIFFGGCTTVISIAVFYLFNYILQLNELAANVVSWIFAVTFAYVTNRTWVFNSEAKGKQIVKEILSFFGSRASTLIFEELLLLVFVSLLHFNGMAIKIGGQVMVLILNYVLSKFFVFGKRGKGNGCDK